MGDFIFMMVECLRTDDCASFRNDLRLVHHIVNLEQKIEYATCTPPTMHLICPPKFCISIVFNFSWDGCNTQEKYKTKVMHFFLFFGGGGGGGK